MSLFAFFFFFNCHIAVQFRSLIGDNFFNVAIQSKQDNFAYDYQIVTIHDCEWMIIFNIRI